MTAFLRRRSSAAVRRLGVAPLFVALLAAAEARAAEGGLQLLPDSPWTLVGLLVLFALLILPVKYLILDPIFGALDARVERTSGTRERAEAVAREAEALLARCEESIRGARAEAERERRGALDEARAEMARQSARARAEAEQVIEDARRQFSRDLAEARSSLRAQAEGLADEAAERVLGRPLS